MDRVHTFAVDKQMRLEVKEYIIDYLKKEIIERSFSNAPTTGFYEAKLIIEGCFAQMDKEFSGEYPKTYINEQE